MAGEAADTTLDESAEDAAFDAAFNGTEAQTTTPDADKPGEATAESQRTADPAPAPAEPEYVQISRQDWEDIRQRTAGFNAAEFRRLLDTANGTIGGIKQRLEKAGQSGPVEVSPADFEELAAEYGEDMAKQISAGLTRAMGRMKPAEQVATQESTTTPAPEVDPFRQQLIDSHLDGIAGGHEWRTDPAEKQRLAAWIATQPDEVKALAASDDVRDAARFLRLYAKAKQTPAPTPDTKPSTRQRQLQAAVNPRGAGGSTPTSPEAEDPFEAGFKAPIPRRR